MAEILNVKSEWTKMRHARQQNEREWFISAAFKRGQHYLEWADAGSVEPNPRRVRLTINRIQQKLRARFAKLIKNRPVPIVIPATAEYNDYLNARATGKVLDYLWRKLDLESAYHDALLWAEICGKSFWWFHWDANKVGRVQQVDPLTGQPVYQDVPLGEPVVEVGSPFEVFVKDPGIARIKDQPAIIRAKLRPIDEVREAHPDFAHLIEPVGSGASTTSYQFERRMATLNALHAGTAIEREDRREMVQVLEYFERPCASYPKGRYIVMAGEVEVRHDEELPYGFSDLPNPYPVVEFADQLTAFQFWGTTLLAQLIDIQREYNLLRSKVAEHLRLLAMPKLLVATQHQLQKGVWTADAGEVVEYVGHPSIPPPQPWFPPNVANDLWRCIELIQKEFDDLTGIHPTAEGALGGATSGFQTNLLQEAADSIHAPEIRAHELSIEDAALKLRRMAKLGFDVPRLISLAGSNYEPEVFEFSSSQIDELADIQVQVGSAMPMLKAARQDMVMNLFKAGLLGDPAAPETKRRTLGLLEMGALEEAYDFAKAHEVKAKRENRDIAEGKPIEAPEFCDNHQLHYDFHASELVGQRLQPPQKRTLQTHMILHGRFIDPMAALQMAMELGLDPPVIQYLQAVVAPMMAPPGGGMAPPPPGAPPPGPPAGTPPTPPAPPGPRGPA